MKKNEKQLTKLVDDIIKENRKRRTLFNKELEDIKFMRDCFVNGNEKVEDINQSKTFNNVMKNNPDIKEKIKKEDNNPIDIEELLKHLNFINLKLERKRLKVSQNKLQISHLYNENETLKAKFKENEDFRLKILDRLEMFEKELKLKETLFKEKENSLIQNFQELEQEKINIEEDYNKKEKLLMQSLTDLQTEKRILQENYKLLNKDYERKVIEMEEVNQRIKEIELYIDENNKNSGDYFKKLRDDMEDLKGKNGSYEKMIETLIYFFKKINASEENELIRLENFNLKLLQQRLIELENTLIFNNKLTEKLYSQIEEKNEMLIESEKINSYLHAKNKEILNENQILRTQLKELVQLNRSLINVASENVLLNKTDHNFLNINNNNSNKNVSQSPNQYKRDTVEFAQKYRNLDIKLKEIEKELLNNKLENTDKTNEEVNISNYNNENQELIKNHSKLKSFSLSPIKKNEEFNLEKLKENLKNFKKTSNYLFIKNMKEAFDK